jgi:hypothetical protein
VEAERLLEAFAESMLERARELEEIAESLGVDVVRPRRRPQQVRTSCSVSALAHSLRASLRISSSVGQRRWRFWHIAVAPSSLELVVGVVEAERASAVLAGPRQERPARIIGAGCPLTQRVRAALVLGRHPHEGIDQGVAWYPEVLLEELNEVVGTAAVAGAQFASSREGIASWRYSYLVHSESPFLWTGSRGVAAPAGPSLYSTSIFYHIHIGFASFLRYNSKKK